MLTDTAVLTDPLETRRGTLGRHDLGMLVGGFGSELHGGFSCVVWRAQVPRRATHQMSCDNRGEKSMRADVSAITDIGPS